MVAAGRGATVAALLVAASGARINRRSPGPDSSCGVKGASGPSSSIVNGQPATECEWRWQAQLRRGTDPGYEFCGGTLLSPEWVLTAAHCVKSANFDVRLGDFNTSDYASANWQTRKAVQVIRHHGYTTNPPRNDFAMVRLESPVTINECVGTACLPQEGADIAPDAQCWISGWGTLSAGGIPPIILQEAQVNIISNDDCVNKFGYGRSDIDDTMICAQGRTSDGKVSDACQGDSGGPLVCESSGRWTVHGATSWGKGCAGANFPGVWARVHLVLDWVEEILDGSVPTHPPTEPPGCPGYCFGLCFLSACKEHCDNCKA